MSLIGWANTTVASKIKQHETVSRSGNVKLKADGSNFNSLLEEQANHCETMGLITVLVLGPAVNDTPHPANDLFPTETSLLSSYGRIALDQVT